MPESIMQQARDVLDKWRRNSTVGNWSIVPIPLDARGSYSFDIVDASSAYAANADDDAAARLIVGTAGNPELVNEIDGLLAHAIRESYFELTLYGRLATRIATAIVAAEKRMNA